MSERQVSAMSVSEPALSYVSPHVMVHAATGGEEYAIHEMYFDVNGDVAAYTEDALSPRATSVTTLRETLLGLLRTEDAEFVLGDLEYFYSRDDVQYWLECIQESVLIFEKR